MVQDEFQIAVPSRTLQKAHAVAGKTGLRRRGAPAVDNLDGVKAFGRVAFAQQPCGDPGAADLVFFAKLAFAAGAAR